MNDRTGRYRHLAGEVVIAIIGLLFIAIGAAYATQTGNLLWGALDVIGFLILLYLVNDYSKRDGASSTPPSQKRRTAPSQPPSVTPQPHPPVAYSQQHSPVYCLNCGKKLEENANFCPKCGAATPKGKAAILKYPRRTGELAGKT